MSDLKQVRRANEVPPPPAASSSSGAAAAAAGASASTALVASANSNTVTIAQNNYRMPVEQTMKLAFKLAVVEDKPIMLDYWVPSLDKKALIGQRDNGEKLLVKSEEEYTTTIQKFYKSGTEFIIITENSIYIVTADCLKRKIS